MTTTNELANAIHDLATTGRLSPESEKAISKLRQETKKVSTNKETK